MQPDLSVITTARCFVFTPRKNKQVLVYNNVSHPFELGMLINSSCTNQGAFHFQENHTVVDSIWFGFPAERFTVATNTRV